MAPGIGWSLWANQQAITALILIGKSTSVDVRKDEISWYHKRTIVHSLLLILKEKKIHLYSPGIGDVVGLASICFGSTRFGDPVFGEIPTLLPTLSIFYCVFLLLIEWPRNQSKGKFQLFLPKLSICFCLYQLFIDWPRNKFKGKF